VEHLGRSFEHALVTGAPDRMALQRYDVHGPRGGFVEKNWLPTNSPIRDTDGRAVGVLHHVEDVTHLLVGTALERHLITPIEETGSGSSVGTSALTGRLVRDSMARKARAQMLIDQSQHAVDRMSKRIDAGP
jgi:hypothetical protein